MFERIQHIKYVVVLMAILIAIGSLITSHYLIRDLEAEERDRVAIWSEAMRSLNTADENTDLSLVIRVLNGNHITPVIVLDKGGDVLTFRNLDHKIRAGMDTIAYVSSLASSYRAAGKEIRIDTPTEYAPDDYIVVCYDESIMLRRLAVYPYIQLGVVCLFVLISIFALFATARAEQNKVWVGLSKETAHQLGTPISSLTAWGEVLREAYPDDPLIPELEKDVKRLERIAERFSKIGSVPEPKPENILEVLERVVVYMDKRTSKKVQITTHFPDTPVRVSIVASLFEWVAENLCKNAVDAMGGSGNIDVYVDETDKEVFVEISDTGKGIPKSDFHSVFKPGFTTKERGWGLGLSLAKRIVEEYHHGKIYVKDSVIGHGTTFRIELPKKG
ncbi:MAG: HAMP domain-containing histidine kinase [Bacteroidaceae bacterium]|nr:HAMP domain-containing histidine kinase [Bacteroidaceae bacterium]MBP5523380.1 HAMP domain-containing histidine kinase [Bacteroidaceae bacterium]